MKVQKNMTTEAYLLKMYVDKLSTQLIHNLNYNSPVFMLQGAVIETEQKVDDLIAARGIELLNVEDILAKWPSGIPYAKSAVRLALKAAETAQLITHMEYYTLSLPFTYGFTDAYMTLLNIAPEVRIVLLKERYPDVKPGSVMYKLLNKEVD
jgi:hypothetical protein